MFTTFSRRLSICLSFVLDTLRSPVVRRTRSPVFLPSAGSPSRIYWRFRSRIVSKQTRTRTHICVYIMYPSEKVFCLALPPHAMQRWWCIIYGRAWDTLEGCGRQRHAFDNRIAPMNITNSSMFNVTATE